MRALRNFAVLRPAGIRSSPSCRFKEYKNAEILLNRAKPEIDVILEPQLIESQVSVDADSRGTDMSGNNATKEPDGKTDRDAAGHDPKP